MTTIHTVNSFGNRHFECTVAEISQNVKAPLPIVKGAVLAAMAVVAQQQCDLEFPDGRSCPVSLIVLPEGVSGIRKTGVTRRAMGPIYEFAKRLNEDYEQKYAKFKEDLAIWEVKDRHIKKSLASLMDEGEPTVELEQTLREHLQAKPEAPVKIRLLFEDASTQALFRGIHPKYRSAAIVSSEGGNIMSGEAFNEFSFQNSAWSGDDLNIDRVGTGHTEVSGVRITIMVMFQPTVVEKFKATKGEMARGTGFLARSLVFRSRSLPGGRMVTDFTQSWDRYDAYSARMTALLEAGWLASQDEGFERRKIRMSPEAARRWAGYGNWVEMNLQGNGRYWNAVDHGSKLAENVARVAAILHFFEGFAGDISLETMEAAISIVDECSYDFVELFAPLPQELQDAETLHSYFERRRKDGRFFPLNYLRQRCPDELRKGGRYYRAVDLLAEQGRVGRFFDAKNGEWIDLFPNLPWPPTVIYPFKGVGRS